VDKNGGKSSFWGEKNTGWGEGGASKTNTAKKTGVGNKKNKEVRGKKKPKMIDTHNNKKLNKKKGEQKKRNPHTERALSRNKKGSKKLLP